MIRGVNGYNFNPDSLKFKFAIQKLSVAAVLKNDISNCPNILESLSSNEQCYLEELNVNITDLLENSENNTEKEISNNINDFICISEKEKEVVQYIGGYLIQRIKKLCAICASEISSNSPSKFILSKEYYNSSLNYPSEFLSKELLDLEVMFKKTIKAFGVEIPFLLDCLQKYKSLSIDNFCSSAHENIGTLMTKKYYKLRIHAEVKWRNERLNNELYEKRKGHKGLSKNVT